jgi:hypothetical protein
MATALQIETRERTEEITRPVPDGRPFFSIPDLAERWRCSRASVYKGLEITGTQQAQQKGSRERIQ